MIEREPTGVPGLDKLIQGGFPKNSVVLVSGSPGTGKSIFCMQFLHAGLKKYGQKVMYVSFEQRIPDLFKQASQMGMDFEPFESKGQAKFVFFDISQRKLPKGESYPSIIRKEIEAFGPERLVIDSLAPLADFPISVNEMADYGLLDELDKLMGGPLSENIMTRMQVHKIVMMLKDFPMTSVITSQIPRDINFFSGDGVSEFLSDSVITLHYLGMAGSKRTLRIEKMRNTKHYDDFVSMDITSRGIVVSKPEETGGLKL